MLEQITTNRLAKELATNRVMAKEYFDMMVQAMERRIFGEAELNWPTEAVFSSIDIGTGRLITLTLDPNGAPNA